MRTFTTTTAKVTYPDALAYAFNPLPVIVTLAEGSEEAVVTIRVTGISDYIDEKRTYGGRATFDAQELLRIAYAELLDSDDVDELNPFILATTVQHTVRKYTAAASGGYIEATEYFARYRYLRTFILEVLVNGERAVLTSISALWGGVAGVIPRIGRDYEKVWCGGSEQVLIVMGDSTVATIPARSGDIKHEIIANVGEVGYYAILLAGNVSGLGSVAIPPEGITVTNTPYFNASTGELDDTHTQKITYHSSELPDTSKTVCYARFLTPEGLVWTTFLRPISSALTSAVESTFLNAKPAQTSQISPRGHERASRKDVAMSIVRRYKYATGYLPRAETTRIREVIASFYVQVLDSSIISDWLRVYPVAATAEIACGKTLSGITIEFELPQPTTQAL